jgi:dihydroneopterin aldolase
MVCADTGRSRGKSPPSVIHCRQGALEICIFGIEIYTIMSGLIEIEGMEFYAYHGYYPSEKKIGSRYLVNVQIRTDCSGAANTDDLDQALDYQNIYDLIKTEMATPSSLLEHVCQRMLNAIHQAFPAIDQATVKLSKMNPPLGGMIEKVSITLSK